MGGPILTLRGRSITVGGLGEGVSLWIAGGCRDFLLGSPNLSGTCLLLVCCLYWCDGCHSRNTLTSVSRLDSVLVSGRESTNRKGSDMTGEQVFALESKRDMKGEPQPHAITEAKRLMREYGLGQGVAWQVALDLHREWGIANGWLAR